MERDRWTFITCYLLLFVTSWIPRSPYFYLLFHGSQDICQVMLLFIDPETVMYSSMRFPCHLSQDLKSLDCNTEKEGQYRGIKHRTAGICVMNVKHVMHPLKHSVT